MSLIDNIARSALHKSVENMLTSEKIEEVEKVIIARLLEGRVIYHALMTVRAGLLEMTSKEETPDEPGIPVA